MNILDFRLPFTLLTGQARLQNLQNANDAHQHALDDLQALAKNQTALAVYDAAYEAQVQRNRAAQAQAQATNGVKTMSETITLEKTPVAVVGTIDQNFLAEYERLALKVGLTKVPVAQERQHAALTAFLSENNIRVYNLDSVQKYMNRLVAEMNRAQLSSISNEFSWTKWSWANLTQYDKPIPFPVLLTIDQIQTALGKDNVEFFVTNIVTTVKADPFLAVSVHGESIPRYVIERWDEPKYRD